MSPRPIFLIAAPRSGSTLLQRLLNSYEDVLLWGEHAGALAGIADAYQKYVGHPRTGVAERERPPGDPTWASLSEAKSPETWQAWLNWATLEDAQTAFRGLVEGLFKPPGLPDHVRWGFKEVRYGSEGVLELLHVLYPEASFVFLVRNGLNTVASQFQAFDQSRRQGRLGQVVRRSRRWSEQVCAFEEWHRRPDVRSVFLKYEDLVANEAVLEEALAQLGLALGDEQREVLQMREGRGAAFSGKGIGTEDERWRSLPFTSLFAAALNLREVSQRLGYPLPRAVSWIPTSRARREH